MARYCDAYKAGFEKGYEKAKKEMERQVLVTSDGKIHPLDVQPQRKTGKWVSNGVEAFGVVEYWVCDQCRDQSKYRTNFCPSCGADMRGEENG